jgi:hypothetical protein
MFPAFADVGAVGFFADRVEVEVAHEVLEVEVVASARRPDLEPRGLASGERLNPVPSHDLVKGFTHMICKCLSARLNLETGAH